MKCFTKKLLFVFYLLFSISISYSNIDSLKRVVINQKPSIHKVDNLNQLSFSLYNRSPQESYQYACDAIDVSEGLTYETGTAQAYRNRAIAQHVQGKYSEALSDYKVSLEIYKQLNDSSGISRIYSNIGLLYTYTEDYEKSTEYYHKSLELVNKADTLNYLKLLNNVGLVHYKTKNYEKAVTYLSDALALGLKYDSMNIEVASIYGNFALTYLDQKDYAKSAEYFKNALKIYKRYNAQYHIGHLYSYLGMIYTKWNKFDLAQDYFAKAIRIQDDMNDTKGLVESLLKASELMIQIGDYGTAKLYLNQIMDTAKESNEYNLLLAACKKKALLLNKEQKFREAFENMYNYVQLKDSLDEQYQKSEISKIEAKYEIREKDVKIALLTKQKELDGLKFIRQRFLLILTSLIAITCIVLIIMLYVNSRYRKRRNRILVSKNRIIYQQKRELEQHKENLEDKIRERTVELEESMLKAEESDRLKSAFLANLSHEVRTPLNSIMGFTALTLDPTFTTEKKEQFSKMVIENSNQLLRIIDDIMDISKLDAGQLQLKVENVQLNKIANELEEIFAEELVKKSGTLITLIKDVPETPLTCQTDSKRIRQILFNLLDNSRKFTYKGHIKFGMKLNKNKLNLFVEDTGEGIAKEYHDVVLQPFRTLDDNLSRISSGNGLGLAIVNNLVNLMGGKLEMKSIPQKGTKISCTIPVNKTEKTA
ncbi:tetratricopeptide repeat protein [Prolixibacteraceae bacterium JC049]|nr:tetratricopeptide repeat protein [Prolixibacteraceae bacterium JC049]